MLSRLCDWRSCLIVVRPETVVRWHRAGWRLLWRYKSRPGRPPIPLELRELIRGMASDNPLWGEERIASELLVKLGIRVSPRTVRKYLPKRLPGRPRGDQRWSTFLSNHAKGIIACDFFLAVTATFRSLYVFVLIHHASRQLLHINVTAHPTAAWTLQQLREVIGEEDGYRYLGPRSGQHLRQNSGSVPRTARPGNCEIAPAESDGQFVRGAICSLDQVRMSESNDLHRTGVVASRDGRIHEPLPSGAKSSGAEQSADPGGGEFRTRSWDGPPEAKTWWDAKFLLPRSGVIGVDPIIG